MLCKLCAESSGSPTRATNPPPELLRKLTERLQDAHRVPPGTHGTSGFQTNTSGCSPNVFGRSRRTTRSRPSPSGSRTSLSRLTARPAASRTTSVVRNNFGCSSVRSVRHRASSEAHGTSGFHRDSSETQLKPACPDSPLCGDSIVSLQRTNRSKAPDRTVQRLWRHGGHFRVDPRLSSLLSTLNFADPRQPTDASPTLSTSDIFCPLDRG